MKKITIALFAVVGCIGASWGQLNYNHVAPPNQGAQSALRAPNGTTAHATQHSIMYIHPYELLPMNICDINSVGFQYLAGTGGASVVGNFTLYLQNTTDFAYAKGGTWSGAVAGMPSVYTGTFGVPGGTAPATVTIPLPAPFNFTGGGLYAAWEFSSAGPFAANGATVASSNTFNGVQEVWIGTGDVTAGPISNTLNGSNFRPALIFNAVNTATNEIEVIDILAPGKVAKMFNTPQNIITHVVNSSIGAQNNVTVALNASGANPYTATQVIPQMAPGSVVTLTFNGYNPTVNGVSTLSVAALFADQNLNNNVKTWSQAVTCGDLAQHPVNVTFNSSYGFTGAAGGIFLARHEIPTTASLSAIRVAVGAASSNTINGYGVLADFAGNILATSTNTVPMAPTTTVTFNFTNPNLTGGVAYMFGVAQMSAGFPIAYVTNTVFIPATYYAMPIAGGGISQSANDGYFGIEPVLTFSNLVVSVNANKTTVCKNDGPGTVILTATGVTGTYTWTGGSNGNSITVTPTVSGASGTVVYTVTATDAASGCPSNIGSKVITVSACAGLSSLNSNGYDIKVYPNPAINGKSTISGLFGTNSITVYNTLGQVISTQVVSEETTTIDLSNQPSGNYLVKITGENNESRSVRIVNN